MHFELGRTAAFGAASATVRLPAGVAPRLVEIPVANLHPSAFYHVRVVVTTDLGTFRGTDRLLHTAHNRPPVLHVRVAAPGLARWPPSAAARDLQRLRALDVTSACCAAATWSEKACAASAPARMSRSSASAASPPAGRITLRVTARDAFGARTRILRTLRLHH